MTRILGKIISDGELSGNTILLRIGDTIGGISGITITLPSAWDYTSCLGAVSSGIVNTDPLHHSRLDELMLGLIGSEITGFQMNPTNVILECGSIRIEKRLSNREDAFEIVDHDRKIRFRMSPGLCVEKFFC